MPGPPVTIGCSVMLTPGASGPPDMGTIIAVLPPLITANGMPLAMGGSTLCLMINSVWGFPYPMLIGPLGSSGDKLTPGEVAQALESMFPEESPQRLRVWAQEFAELFTRSIYKWVQAPLSLHVGSLDLDRERALQLPVVQRLEWDGDPDS